MSFESTDKRRISRAGTWVSTSVGHRRITTVRTRWAHLCVALTIIRGLADSTETVCI